MFREGRRRGGKKANFDVYWKKHKLTRSGSNGIDWYRYQTHVLIPLLLPFAQRMKAIKPDIIVQEDGALSHIAKEQKRVWMDFGITRMIWPGNSPDLNMIELAWFHLKRVITRRRALSTRTEVTAAWIQAWEELEQWRINDWIRKIRGRVQEVIRLKGGNEYGHGAE